MFHLSIHLDEQLAPPPADDDSDALIGLQCSRQTARIFTELRSFLELTKKSLPPKDSGWSSCIILRPYEGDRAGMMLMDSMIMDMIVTYPRHVANDPYARQ